MLTIWYNISTVGHPMKPNECLISHSNLRLPFYRTGASQNIRRSAYFLNSSHMSINVVKTFTLSDYYYSLLLAIVIALQLNIFWSHNFEFHLLRTPLHWELSLFEVAISFEIHILFISVLSYIDTNGVKLINLVQ